MRKNIKLSLITALLMLMAVSCELDRYPYDQIEQSQAFQTISDAEQLRNGMYANLRGRLYGIYTYATDLQADIFNATLEYGNRNGDVHRWTTFLSDDNTISGVWRGYYGALVNVNNLINKIDNIVPEDAAEQAELDQYKGEAFLIRAYYYHQLVLRFAKDYEPATAGTDLGVPLVLEFDVTLLPGRASMQATYDQIISDITQAKTLLAGVSGMQDAPYLTYDAALALEARVRLCMHDYTGASAVANSLITSGTYTLIDNEMDLSIMWVNDESTEVIFQYPLSAPNELGNTQGLYLRYQPAEDYYQPDWVPQQWVIDLYDPADIRRNVYLDQKLINMQGLDYPNIWVINKYSGNPALFTTVNTNYQQKPKVFRLAEMYLIKAEADAQTPATEAAALTALNSLRTNRGLTALSGLTGTALMDAIKEERTREFMAEGFRLDDLKRWHMGFTRSTPQSMDFIQTGADFEQKTVAADADKFVWGIPANDITTNPNIKDQQNNGW